ncbi:MAG: polyribonucleotide nucleotidyltransferase [Chloroflexota bacterium]|nr:MAG: polyribonucleotide nucleotidyltransferase [Chloroflexota bacterium]
MTQKYEIEFGGRSLSIEYGRLAEQANAAVLVRYGDTILLAAATASQTPREGVDFFPLTVDYEERMYAAGKIPGNFFRREGRPSENATLTARLTDRPLRPLFPNDFRNDVQVIITTLAWDGENDPDILALLGGSSALTISDIPFDGPVAAVRVGYVDGEYVLNPTLSQLKQSRLDLVVAGTDEAVNMLEAGANEVPESVVIEAISFGHRAVKELIALQRRMRAEIGKPKFTYPSFRPDEALVREIHDLVGTSINAVLDTQEKHARAKAASEITKSVAEKIGTDADRKVIAGIVEEIEAEALRERILGGGKRPDGRGLNDLRTISCEVGVLPRTHGTGLFQRGQTQVLSIATLGSTADAQQIDSLGVDEHKRYMHHYNMPPYSVGEVRRTGSPGRREIGHGALAERALLPVIPPKEQFPYTLRVVSEVVSSNGSTSMGSVCGSTLALMDAGVPIKAPVAGISIGLVMADDGRRALLTDIQGIEDHHGDMDFKVAGTTDGVTAIQLDLKARGLPMDLIPEIFARARESRLYILGKMAEAISETRPELSQYAPRVMKTSIPVDRIGQLIGPGGKNIRGLQDTYKVKIDVEEDGTVYVAGVDGPLAEKARASIELLGKDIEIGQTYLGKVTRTTTFGAFVEILPGKEGLVRIGELAEERVNRVEDIVSIGDEIMVKVIEIDSQGRVNMSRRAILTGDSAPRPDEDGDRPRFGDRRGPPRQFEGGDRGPRNFGGDRGPRSFDRGPRDFGGGRPPGPRPPRPGGFREGPPRSDGESPE